MQYAEQVPWEQIWCEGDNEAPLRIVTLTLSRCSDPSDSVLLLTLEAVHPKKGL